jgi:hypothetical protein
MKGLKTVIVLSLGSIGSAAPLPDNEPTCTNITIPITASAKNLAFPPYPNSTAPGVIFQYLKSFNSSTLPATTVSGTFEISATYCEPVVKVAGREGTVQMLLHGLAATKVRTQNHGPQ